MEYVQQSAALIKRLSELRREAEKASVLTIRSVAEKMAVIQEQLNILHHNAIFCGGANNGKS